LEEFDMKNFLKLFGIIALAAVIGFSFVACDNGTTGGGGFNGTWRESSGDSIVFSGNNFTMIDNGVEILKGTYSTSGNTLTLTFTQVKGSLLGGAELGISPNQWYTESQFRQALINYLVGMGAPQAQAAAIADQALAASDNPYRTPMTYTYSLQGNTLILDGTVFTKV
jgi:hypothetical protein